LASLDLSLIDLDLDFDRLTLLSTNDCGALGMCLTMDMATVLCGKALWISRGFLPTVKKYL
jgi:hypothetical protein